MTAICDFFTRSELISLYFENKTLRVKLSLLFGVLTSLFYVVFNAISGIAYGSPWLLTVAFYHTLLGVARYILFMADGRGRVNSFCRACLYSGIIMLAVSATVTAMVIRILRDGSPSQYRGAVIIVVGAYAAYSALSSILDIRRAGSDAMPSHRAAYAVRLSAAITSAFNLISVLMPSLAISAEAATALHLIFGAASALSVFALSLFVLFRAAAVN